MVKRSSTFTVSSQTASDSFDHPTKRLKPVRKVEPVRPDTPPPWLHEAAANFVASTPHLKRTGGFYSWGTWLEDLRHVSQWTHAGPPSHPPAPVAWRTLINACRTSGQVHGTAALYRAKSDLVSIIINFVFRRGEEERLTHKGEKPAHERDIMRRVRAVVTRQRRHEAAALTLIRFLDLAFVLSAYKDCRLAAADRSNVTRADVSKQVEHEILLLSTKPNSKEIRDMISRMEQCMWEDRWLPWYEQVPGVRDEMVISARDAALAFCEGLPFPHVRVGAGVRGLARDHLAGPGSMDEWLVSLLDPSLSQRWSRLAEVYETAVCEEKGEEDALLEETSRRVLQIVLEPLTEVRGDIDPAFSKLVDAAPGIIVTQSVRITGRFTFRQMLELYIHLAMFNRFLEGTCQRNALPSIESIQSGVVLYEEVRRRVLDIRSVIDEDKVEMLTEWCLRTRKFHPSVMVVKNYAAYQQSAIRAALGSAFMRHVAKPGLPFPDINVPESDPLTYAAVVAEWDAHLALKITDAAVRIGSGVRNRFSSGDSEGVDLYNYRRIIVCEAALERCSGDTRAAAGIMRRLHPIWDVCEQDKAVGAFNRKGAMMLQLAADKGNFEAACIYGTLLCSFEWRGRRKQCGLPKALESGIAFICKAVSAGNTSAAADLLHLLSCNPTYRGDYVWEMPDHVINYTVKCLKDAAIEEPSIRLYLGYLHSMGARGVPVDCRAAAKAYLSVLESANSTPRYQAYAANNLGILRILNAPGVRSTLADASLAMKYIKTSALAGDPKAESNLAALLCLEGLDSPEYLEQAKKEYWRLLEKNGGDAPLTVLQADKIASEVTLYEMIIHGHQRERFCADLKTEGMVLKRYGTLLEQESLPYAPRISYASRRPVSNRRPSA